MDYEVFLLSRIREEYDRTGDNAASVARGLASTARVIMAAAAIMVVVFLSVVLGVNVSVKQIGLGLGAAVLIGKRHCLRPVADPSGTWGLAVIATDSEQVVRAIGDADPAVLSKAFCYEVYPMANAPVRP